MTQKRWLLLGAGLLAAVLVIVLLLRDRTVQRGEQSADRPAGRDVAQGTPSPGPGGAPVAREWNLLEYEECTLGSLVGDFRRASGSAAYRRYLLGRLKAIAGTLKPEELWALIEQERDPAVLEALAVTWVAHFNGERDPGLLQKLLGRMADEQDPALQAALVRALRETVDPSSEVLAGLKGAPVSYTELVQSPAAEVRQAVVDNLLAESQRMFGRAQGVAEAQVAVAGAAADPAQAAAVLAGTSLEAVGKETVGKVEKLLAAGKDPAVRAAAAMALGGVAATESKDVQDELVARYEAERDPGVRKAILAGIVRLGLTRSIPVLERLRGREADADVKAEIDTWLALLARNPQQWLLLQRDKDRLDKGG